MKDSEIIKWVKSDLIVKDGDIDRAILMAVKKARQDTAEQIFKELEREILENERSKGITDRKLRKARKENKRRKIDRYHHDAVGNNAILCFLIKFKKKLKEKLK